MDGLYFFNTVITYNGPNELFLWWVLSGVLQGCPMSGFSFAVALDPFLRWLELVTAPWPLVCIRACADDLGGVFPNIIALLHVIPVFEAAQKTAGLTLKPKKCNIVP